MSRESLEVDEALNDHVVRMRTDLSVCKHGRCMFWRSILIYHLEYLVSIRTSILLEELFLIYSRPSAHLWILG